MHNLQVRLEYTLKGRTDGVNVAPWSVEIKICPLLGSHEFVYIPVAFRYSLEAMIKRKRGFTYKI